MTVPAAPLLAAPVQRDRPPAVSGDTRAAVTTLASLRKARGLGPVRPDPLLEGVAKRQAEAMAAARTLSHTVGGAFAARMERAGIGYGTSAENLGYGYTDLADVFAGWMASAGHRDNMLQPWVTRAGLAKARGADNRLYWALVLASDDRPPGPVMGDPGPVRRLPSERVRARPSRD